MPREQGRQAQREPFVGEQAGREVDRDVEARTARFNSAAAATAFSRTKSVSLAMLLLLCGGNEFGRRDRALFRVGPAGQRLSTDDPARCQVELGLIGDPHFAFVDGVVELAEHRQPPRGVGEALRIVEFPLEAVVRSFVGRHQCARQAAGKRAAAADLDAKADRTRRATDRRLEPASERARKAPRDDCQRTVGLVEPGEDSAVALIESCGRGAPTDPGYDLVDQMPLAIRGEA